MGSVRKATIDFTSDIAYLTYCTKLVRKRIKDDGVKESISLKQKREQQRKALQLKREKEKILKD